MYESVGRGFITKKKLNELFKYHHKSLKSYANSFVTFQTEAKPININNYELGIAVNLATCCSPISGDDIISIISHGRGLIVHNTMCDSLSYYHKDNFYRSSWGEGKKSFKFPSRIEIVIKINLEHWHI